MGAEALGVIEGSAPPPWGDGPGSWFSNPPERDVLQLGGGNGARVTGVWGSHPGTALAAISSRYLMPCITPRNDGGRQNG